MIKCVHDYMSSGRHGHMLKEGFRTADAKDQFGAGEGACRSSPAVNSLEARSNLIMPTATLPMILPICAHMVPDARGVSGTGRALRAGLYSPEAPRACGSPSRPDGDDPSREQTGRLWGASKEEGRRLQSASGVGDQVNARQSIVASLHLFPISRCKDSSRTLSPRHDEDGSAKKVWNGFPGTQHSIRLDKRGRPKRRLQHANSSRKGARWLAR